MTQQEQIEKAAEECVIKHFPAYKDKDYVLRDEKIKYFSRLFIDGVNWSLEHLLISVEDELPKENHCVLGITDMDSMDGNILVVKLKEGIWWWQDGFVCGKDNLTGENIYSSECSVGSIKIGGITHWMEIPKIGGKE